MPNTIVLTLPDGTFDETPVPSDGQRLQGGAQGKLAFEKDDGSLDLAPAMKQELKAVTRFPVLG